ncbi:oxygen-independent coproporphyrinogen-3 oxidase [Plasticicumulans lactativorans]|uniref:Heme chaperone HemW n=1 Tax=Plasticicumulans lactativorans TaxID=1133106 RepID=A0A4R2L1A7_9GAMM|nr:radical SAM family heme chaperone HemW [Plasticicumulans lactativorans]TCO80234.1 oxygen-independent coproporphyrinogen-3 oxidase [Plasticicumulans lactativorans]
MLQFSAAIPLALYVHIPWCVRKCPYCDFNSHAAPEALPEATYVDALLADLEQDLPRVWGRRLESVFIGGGTPSLFSAEAIDRLLSGLRARLPLHGALEVTLEANPGTVEAAKFAEFRAAGINRLSIGVQSFADDALVALGRIHGRREAIRAAEAAHASGFDNFNLDLMFGLPRQTPAAALADVATAIDLEPTHLSHYQLTLEPNTLFHRHPPPLPDDDALWTMQEACQARLAAHGYAQYEVSAYARAGRQCRHNLNYWEFGDYLGIGAGAHAKLTDPARGEIQRLWKTRHPRDYLERAASPAVRGGDAPVPTAELPFEFMLNALRLNAGVPASLFGERTGLPDETIAATVARARDEGLLDPDPARLQASERGLRFLNDLLTRFIAEPPA